MHRPHQPTAEFLTALRLDSKVAAKIREVARVAPQGEHWVALAQLQIVGMLTQLRLYTEAEQTQCSNTFYIHRTLSNPCNLGTLLTVSCDDVTPGMLRASKRGGACSALQPFMQLKTIDQSLCLTFCQELSCQISCSPLTQASILYCD